MPGGFRRKILNLNTSLAHSYKRMAYLKSDYSYYIYGINMNLYTCKLYSLVAMSSEKEKEDEIQTVKPKERSETYKEKEKEEFETLEMESTGGGKEGGGG